MEVDLRSSNEPTSSQLFFAAVGERVMMFRETAGLSPHQLGIKAKVSPDYIRRLERGRANPTMARMERIALALNTTLHELLDIDGDELGMAARSARDRPDA